MITCFYCFISTHFRQLFFQLFAQLFYFPLSVTTLHRLVSPHVISLTTSRWLLSTITRIRSLSSTTTFRFPFIGMFLSSPCLIFCPNFSLRFIRTISVWYSSMFYLFYLILLLASVATLESSSHIVKLRSSQLVGVRWLMSWTTRSSTLIVLPWFASTLRTLLFLAYLKMLKIHLIKYRPVVSSQGVWVVVWVHFVLINKCIFKVFMFFLIGQTYLTNQKKLCRHTSSVDSFLPSILRLLEPLVRIQSTPSRLH